VFGSEGAIPAHKVFLPCSNINGRWGAGFDTGWAEIPCCVHLLSPSSPDGVRVLDCGRKPGTGIWPNAMHGKNKRDHILEYRYPQSVGTGMHLFVEGHKGVTGYAVLLKSGARPGIGCLRGWAQREQCFPRFTLPGKYIGRCWDLVNEVRRGWRGGSNNGMKGYSVIMDGVDLGAAFSGQLGSR